MNIAQHYAHNETGVEQMSNAYSYTGFCPGNIARVFGTGPTPDVAETECMEAVREYVRRRRDTGPVDSWRVLPTKHLR